MLDNNINSTVITIVS